VASSVWAHLEDGVNEPWFCQPKDKDTAGEEERVRVFLHDLRVMAPGINVFAVPNAGRRTRWEIAKAKREGLKTGALDLVLTWAGGSAYVEWKDGIEMPTASQIDMLNTLFRQGHNAGVFRTSEACFRWLRDANAPIRGVFN
jgi:hypothetical protein